MNKRRDIVIEIVIIMMRKRYDDGHNDNSNEFIESSFPWSSRHLKNFIYLDKIFQKKE